MKTLADRINEKMADLGMTQEDLANIIGISQAAIQKITSGKTQHPKKILDIARVLKSSPDWLMTGKESVIAIRPQTDPLAGLTEIQRTLILKMQALTERQQSDLLKSVEDIAEKNEVMFSELLARSQKRA